MQKVIDKLFDFYLIQNYHYLVQMKDGGWFAKNDRQKGVMPYHLKAHLNGGTPIGTFAGKYLTKFICFDVDFEERMDIAKWATYKLTRTLDEMGLHEYAISFSGGKGYHVELFFDKALTVEAAREFYSFTLHKAELESVEGGEVEFRPSAQGVKLPMCIQKKTGNYCGFCTGVDDGLRVMGRAESTAHFLTLKKTDHTAILSIIEDGRSYDNREAADMENAISRHKPLPSYNQSESYTLKHAAERYYTGLTRPGQRHKSFLLIGRLMNHNGVERPDALAAITEWFGWQDKRYYTTDWDACLKDLRECVDHVFDNDKTLIIEQHDLTVSFSEIDAIIRLCPRKNQKALAYAMLVHSKRWGGSVFYMTYMQMGEAVGIDESTARRQINQLEKMGVVEIVSRNQKQKGTFKKKPNYYRMILVADEITDERIYEVSQTPDIAKVLKHFYTEKEIRALLPRRQSDAVLTVPYSIHRE